eukprot:CAMPEP_0195255906 /NCGR_PEP_ID=MMETSP0706-20130129/5925_1 /TAXON_ID=33640 /ORGANISM="Asterionellopsis glacialis, Strain CCMP134" /LENGTH=80 /DNA_ID=CAMNT_0040308859 /DNA_START=232 /DNA_END=474 /DNA_ORIENTATION=-
MERSDNVLPTLSIEVARPLRSNPYTSKSSISKRPPETDIKGGLSKVPQRPVQPREKFSSTTRPNAPPPPIAICPSSTSQT